MEGGGGKVYGRLRGFASFIHNMLFMRVVEDRKYFILF
jgi:hypothetical protein